MAAKKKNEQPTAKAEPMKYESIRVPNARSVLRRQARESEDGTVDVSALAPEPNKEG